MKRSHVCTTALPDIWRWADPMRLPTISLVREADDTGKWTRIRPKETRKDYSNRNADIGSKRAATRRGRRGDDYQHKTDDHNDCVHAAVSQ